MFGGACRASSTGGKLSIAAGRELTSPGSQTPASTEALGFNRALMKPGSASPEGCAWWGRGASLLKWEAEDRGGKGADLSGVSDPGFNRSRLQRRDLGFNEEWIQACLLNPIPSCFQACRSDSSMIVCIGCLAFG